MYIKNRISQFAFCPASIKNAHFIVLGRSKYKVMAKYARRRLVQFVPPVPVQSRLCTIGRESHSRSLTTEGPQHA